LSVHTIHAGDNDFFVTDSLEMTGTIRAFDESLQSRTEQRVDEIVRHISKLQGVTATVDMIPEVPSQLNHESLFEASGRACKRLFSQDKILDRPPAFLGAEDFAVFGQDVPSYFYWLGTNTLENGSELHHQPGFVVDTHAIPLGVSLLTLSVLELLEESE